MARTIDGASGSLPGNGGFERERVLLEGQRAVLERLATGAPLEETLDALLRALERGSEGLRFAILLRDPGGRLSLAAAPSLPGRLRRSLGAEVVSGEAERSELALRHGFPARWSAPIFDAERRELGIFEVYRRGSGDASRFHQRLIEIGVYAAAVAIVGKRDEAERRSLERGLEESQSRLEEAQELARLGSWTLDLDTGAGTWSREMYRLFGRPPPLGPPGFEEFLGRVHAGDRVRLVEVQERALSSGEPQVLEFRAAAAGGRERWFEARVRTRSTSGRARELQGTVQDVTARKKSERERAGALAEVELLGQAIERSLEEVYVFDRGTLVFTLVNEGARRNLGYDSEELRSLTPLDLAPELTEEGFRDLLASLVDGSLDQVALETLHRRKDGTSYPIELRVQLHGAGAAARFVALGADLEAGRRAERERRLVEQRLRLAVEAANVGLWDWDLATNRIFYSREWKRQLGYEEHEIADDFAEWEKRVHPEDLPGAQATIRAYLDDPWPDYTNEFRLRHKDGSYRRILAQASVQRDEQGRPVRMLGSHLDLTERYRAEQVLRERERQLRLFVEHAPAAIAMLDRDLRYLVVSRRWYGDYRLEEEDVVGRCHYDVFPDLPERWKEVHRRCLAGAVERCEEDPFPRGDGRIDWVRWEIHPWHHADGAIGGIAIFSEVVTERREAERALQESRERLQRAVRAGNVGLWDWDQTHGRVYYSPEWKRQIGHQESEISEEFSEWRDRVHPEDLPRLLAALERCRTDPGFELRQEYRLRHRDGGYRHMLAVGSTMLDARTADTHVVGSQVDLTDRVELESQLRHAQRLESVGRLAGGVAHDFNNLLTVVRGYAELVAGGLAEGDPLLKMVREIAQAGERASALTRQLLVFSRRQVSQPEVLDVREVVQGMHDMLRRLLGEDVELRVALEGEPATVEVDRGQIEQVVMNLSVNARDAMPRGGRLEISVRRAERPADGASSVVLEVGDTGEGMDEATVDRIFEPYFTTKSQGKGTGLGLSTVYGIVEQSGGRIEVESEPGRGSVFRIWLPWVTGESASAPRAVPRAAEGGDETILLVEDEETVRNLARRVLEAAGYRVLVAPGAGEALALLEDLRGRVDLVISDVVMPGMSGTELAERLATAHPEVQVLLTSGYSEEALTSRRQAPVRFPLLPKPFTVAALKRSVREVLDARRASTGREHAARPPGENRG